MVQALTIGELKLRIGQPVFIVESQNREIKPCRNRISWISLDEIVFENGFITMNTPYLKRMLPEHTTENLLKRNWLKYILRLTYESVNSIEIVKKGVECMTLKSLLEKIDGGNLIEVDDYVYSTKLSGTTRTTIGNLSEEQLESNVTRVSNTMRDGAPILRIYICEQRRV